MWSKIRAGPLAHAFRVLARHRRHVAHVRVRERGDQAVDLDVPAADRGDGLAEIDLHGPGAPVELEVPVAVGPVPLAPLPHVALHRRVGAPEALLLDEPVVHAPGGVALLAGHEPVRGQPRVDRLRMRVDQGAPSLPDRGLQGAVLHGRVFPDGIPRHAKPSGDFAPGHAPCVENPDTLLYRHRFRHSFPFPSGLVRPGVSRLGKIAGLWRAGALHLAISVKRTNSYRFFGPESYAASA